MSLRFETTPSHLSQLDFISHSTVDIFPVGSDLESPMTWYRKPTDTAIYETKLPDKMIEDILNQSEVLDVSDPLIYEAYIAKLKAEHLAEYGHFANKANIQLECQKLGINEDTTRIIAPRDLGTLFKYVKGLTDQGRIVWIGSSTKDDMTDPWGDKSNINNSVTPPLYKKITSLDDLLSILPSINMFKNNHPDMLLKVFPQDGESPTLTSLVFEYNDQSKKISFHFKPGQFTPNGLRSEKPSRTIDVEVDLNHDIPFITIENESDLEWVEIVLNSLDMFSKVEQIDFKNSPVVNVEAMHLNSDKTLRFVTDIIYGRGTKTTQYDPIPFTQMIQSVRKGIVQLKHSSLRVKDVLRSRNNFIESMISAIKSPNAEKSICEAQTILAVLPYLDFHSIGVDIPPIILSNLEAIASKRPAIYPSSKAILYLQNKRIIFLEKDIDNDSRMALLTQGSDSRIVMK